MVLRNVPDVDRVLGQALAALIEAERSALLC